MPYKIFSPICSLLVLLLLTACITKKPVSTTKSPAPVEVPATPETQEEVATPENATEVDPEQNVEQEAPEVAVEEVPAPGKKASWSPGLTSLPANRGKPRSLFMTRCTSG